MRSFIALGVVALSAVASAQFSRLVVFGDSLNDTGNVFGLTGGTYPAAPYWNGRFSNGPVWLETMASTLGLGSTAAIQGGTNFAWGGAELNPNSANSTLGTPNVGAQIGQFQLAGLSFTANDLVVVSGGGNDFFNGATNPAQVAGWLTGHMQSLFTLGARKCLVPNLPLLGYTPGYLGGATQAGANALSAGYNAALTANLAAFRAANGSATVMEMNIQALMEDARTNPSNYGFTNVTQNYIAYGLGAGANADQWLFWDDVHPTRAGHQRIAQLALQAVPEPSSMAVLGLGLLLLRRKSR